MAHKTFCDICDIEVDWYELVNVDIRRGKRGEYCKKCWYDEKNWKDIHEKPASDME
jgi:hypothetical protein